MILHCIYVYKKSNIQRCFPEASGCTQIFPHSFVVNSINHQKPTKVPLPAHLLQFHVILLEYPAFRVWTVASGRYTEDEHDAKDHKFRQLSNWRWSDLANGSWWDLRPYDGTSIIICWSIISMLVIRIQLQQHVFHLCIGLIKPTLVELTYYIRFEENGFQKIHDFVSLSYLPPQPVNQGKRTLLRSHFCVSCFLLWNASQTDPLEKQIDSFTQMFLWDLRKHPRSQPKRSI